MEQQLLPKSIEQRALNFMEQGNDSIDSVRMAFEEEENTMYIAAYGVDMKTGQLKRDVQKELISKMSERVYNKLKSQ